MKKIISLCIGLILVSHLGFSQKSQVKIGNNPYTLNASAALEVESTSKGFLPPRMTKSQRDVIPVSTATKGLTVYCTDCAPAGLYSYDGTAWTAVGSLSGASLADGKILIGNSANAATAIAPSGDVTISNTGATAIGTNKVTNAMLQGSIDLTAKVTGILPIANGGTGSTTKNFVDLTTNQTIAGIKDFGAVTASTINKVAITTPTTGATLTIANGKTLTANNSISLTGTDGTTMTFPSTTATIARTDATQSFTGTQFFKTDINIDGITVGKGGGTLSNTVVGNSSLLNNTTGNFNVAVGGFSLYSNTSGDNNTAQGYLSLYNTKLDDPLDQVSASNNTAQGSSSLYFNTLGYGNTAQGSKSLYFNTLGYGNTAQGQSSLYHNTTGNYNTAVGEYSGKGLTEGSNNIFIGRHPNTTGITTGSNNTIIGNYIAGLTSDLSNNVILADGAGNIRAQHDGTSWSFGKSKSVVFSGSTSGTATLAAPAVAGTNTAITLPSETGTLNTVGPSVSYFLKGNQTALTMGDYNKVKFNTKVWDENPVTVVSSGVSTGRFTPKKLGIYLITAEVTLGGGGYVLKHVVSVYKNNAIYKKGGENTSPRNTISCLVTINSTSDYIEIFDYIDGSSINFVAGNTDTVTPSDDPDTYFQAVYIRPLPVVP